MRVWRICRSRHAATAFSGEGARRFSGRWHPAGVPVVYSSLSLSLAALETFVHLDLSVMPDDLVSVAATLPLDADRCEHVELTSLPSDWKRPNHPALQEIGAEWVRSGRSLALMVPSAVIEDEWNVLINPGHSAATEIRIDSPKAFRFDARMFR